MASRSVRKSLESLIVLLRPSNENEGKYRESGMPPVGFIFLFLLTQPPGLNGAASYIAGIRMKLRELSVALQSLSNSFHALVDLYYDRRIYTAISKMLNELQACCRYPIIADTAVIDGTILQVIDGLFQRSCMFSFPKSVLHIENVIHNR